MDDVGNLLEHYGVPVEQHHGATIADIENALAEGDGVIVGVDGGELSNPEFDFDQPLVDYQGIPGQGADHAVQVVGLDYTDPDNPMVIINDPGSSDGQGKAIPLEAFLAAWEDSGNFLVTADRPDGTTAPKEGGMYEFEEIPAERAELHQVRFGYSYTVPGETESGNAVAWSTSSNTYYDQKTWETVEPK
jgi:hypothetical protein